MKEELQIIQKELEGKLKECKLANRVSFDVSALSELHRLTNGDWEIVELYARNAVLDALQNKRTIVTKTDIEAVNIADALQLISGGKDIWDDVRYIGTIPNLRPEGMQLKRLTSLFDADRERDAMNAVRDGRLPKYALTDLVQYNSGVLGPEVIVPFKLDPSRNEIMAVAESVARFVTKHTNEPQEVEDITQTNFLIQYFIRPQTQPGENKFLNSPNYRVVRDLGRGYNIDKAKGMVRVNQEHLCKYDKTTLEAYVLSLKGK